METENQAGNSADKPIGPGTRLNDIFEIDEKIATGGMGEVFRGHNVTTDEAVAIKIVLGEFARDEKYSNLFFKEARVLSSLNHPSIVRYQIFTIDKAIGRPYLVMEYIQGMSLAERLASGPLSVSEVRRLTTKLADGMDAAHAAGVIHRDLSPDNILLANNDVAQPKLIDFGIARTTQAGHKTFLAGEFAGRTNFASPEQFGLFGGNVDAASDVYSLGLVVINALQGTPLDMNGTQYEMIEKRKRVPDLSALDADLRPIIEEMLVPDPANRHLAMADVADYFSGREPLANLKRSAEMPAADPDDFWIQPAAETVSPTSPPEQAPPAGNATIVSLSRGEPPAAPEPDKRQQAPANATVIANVPVPQADAVPPQPDASERQDMPPALDLPPVEAKPIAWESQSVVITPPAAALPVRKRGRVWPYGLAAAVLVLAAGGAGAFYSGALKNVVLPPQLDALLHRKSTAETHDQVAQDDLPDLTAQPDKQPVKTQAKTETSTTHVAKKADALSNDSSKPAQDSRADETKPKKDKDGTGLNPTHVVTATTVDTSSTKVEKKPEVQQAEVKPVVVQPHSADADKDKTDADVLPEGVVKYDDTLPAKENTEADNVAKLQNTNGKLDTVAQTHKQDTVQTVTHGQQTETTTVQKAETSSDDHQEVTPDSQNETATDGGTRPGDVLPADKQDKVEQTRLPANKAGQQTDDTTSVKPKNDAASTETSKQGLDQTTGKTESPEKVAKKQNTPGQKETLSTTKKSEAGKTEETARADAAETHVATTVTNPAKTEDAGDDTNNSDANTGLPGDILPSDNGVKDTTSDNSGEAVHDAARPSDTVTTTGKHPETDHPADSATTENKAGQQTDLKADTATESAATETNPVDATESDQLPANDSGETTARTDKSAEQTELATSKTGQTSDTATKPSDTTTKTDQLPAANDNGENTAKTDTSVEQADQTTDNGAKPSDSTTDSGLPDEADTHANNGKPADTAQTGNDVQKEPAKDQTTGNKVDDGGDTLPVNPASETGKKPAAQDVALGEQTTEMKHPEIAVDEGLAKRVSWVAGFEAGDCFYARMTTNVASAAGILAVAADSQPFYSLNDSFTSTFGMEPALRGVPIDRRQCAVTDLLRQLRQAPNEALDLKLIPADQVVSGDPLSSRVSGVTKPVRTVYLIDNDGKVYDFSKDVRNKAGPDIEFGYRFKEDKSKVKTFKIMLLIGSDEPLAIDFPRKPPLAKNIIPMIAKAINLQPGGVQYAYGFFKVVPKTN